MIPTKIILQPSQNLELVYASGLCLGEAAVVRSNNNVFGWDLSSFDLKVSRVLGPMGLRDGDSDSDS